MLRFDCFLLYVPARKKWLLAVVVAAAALAPAATAAKVQWNETAKNGKAPVMSFQVTSLTFGSSSWSAHVTFRNLSKKPVKIGDEFGAAIYGDPKSENLSRAIGFAEALRFSPGRPTVLAPGASWSGTIGGDGSLSSSGTTRWARVVFGPLRGLPGQKADVVWVTDHALTLPGAGGPSTGVI